MSSVTQISQALHAVFDHADAIARYTDFVQRERLGKITGKRFALTQVFGLLHPGKGAMSDLSHFARHSGMKITGQSLHERYTRTAATFLQELLNVAFTQVVAADPVALPLLRRFREVIVEDSSTFTLPDACREWWQGCGGSSAKGTQSAFKIQVRWDLLRGGFTGLGLQDGRTPDNRSPLKGVRRGAKSVRISDLGYFDTAEFAEEAEAEEYFLSRYKSSVKLYDKQGNELNLLAFLSEQGNARQVDCPVQVSAARRVPARLIAVPVPEEVAVKRQTGHRQKAHKHGRQPSEQLLDLCGWTILLTNIPQEELSVQEALVVLRLRWQVELLFKLWKQVGQADESRSEQPWHVLCDIYAKLLGLLISHWLMIVGCWHIPSRSMVKATNAIRSDIVLIARALSGKGNLMDVLNEIIEGLEGCRMDSRRTAPNTYQLMCPPPSQLKTG
ncbi:MAG: IS4 family transposase [Ktedonobacteraceae bacterium]